MSNKHNTQYQTPIEVVTNAQLAIAEGDHAIIFNKDSTRYEGWNGTSWSPLAEIPETTAFDSRIIVNQDNVSTTLGGIIDPTKEYFLDGIIDMSGVTVEVPAGGINIKGFDFDVSKMVCSDSDYTMFVSAVGGSGNFLGIDYSIEVTGVDSKVYELESANGIEAFELARVNYNNCTSLGYIDNYRQGLESGTGRFGGSPSLELRGDWDGFRISTSIVRSLSASMVEPLFKAGVDFSMLSRFLTDVNCDLPALASFIDFSPVNLPNPSTLQIHGALITRNGVSNPEDINLLPNISKGDLSSDFVGNQGINNTFVGGVSTLTSEVVTSITSTGSFVPVSGTFTTSKLEHFDSPLNGQLRHLGNNPTEFRLVCDLILKGGANNVIKVRIRKWNNLTSSFETATEQTRQINSLIGSRDVGFFNIYSNVILNQNDYIFIEVSNESNTNNVTMELSSFMNVEAR